MGYQKPLYLTTKRDVFYYTRRVPQSLKAQFQSPRFVKCLHTKSPDKAGRLSIELSSRLENIWDRMRLEVLDFKSPEPQSVVFGPTSISARNYFLISDGFDPYLRLKGTAKTDNFRKCTKAINAISLIALVTSQLGTYPPVMVLTLEITC